MDKPESVETGSIVYFLYGNDFLLGVAGRAGIYHGPGCIENALEDKPNFPRIPWNAVPRYVVVATHDQAVQGYWESVYGGLLQ
jgi:hypothetical protein